MADRVVKETVTETAVDDAPVANDTASGMTVVVRVVYYVVGIINTLLAVRIVLLLLSANRDNGFVDFIYSLSGVFAQPFYGIFNYEPAYGSSVFEISSVVAIIVYTLVAVGIVKLLTIADRKQA